MFRDENQLNENEFPNGSVLSSPDSHVNEMDSSEANSGLDLRDPRAPAPFNILQLPIENLLHVNSFLEVKDKLRLRQTCSFFNQVTDPFYLIWNNFFNEVLRLTPFFDFSKLNFSNERLLSDLTKMHILATLKGKKVVDTAEWLNANPKCILFLWEFVQLPPGQYDFADIRRRKDDPKREWDNYFNDNVYLESVSDKELLALYIHDFRKAYENWVLLNSVLETSQKDMHLALLKTSTDLLNKIIFSNHFDFFSQKNMMAIVRLLDNPQRQRIEACLVDLTQLNLKPEIFNILKTELMQRCLKILCNINIENTGHIEKVKNLLITNLRELMSPYLPTIAFKNLQFTARWVFNTIELRHSMQSKLSSLGFTAKAGKINGQFAIDLANVEPVELILACEKYKKLESQPATKRQYK